MGLVGGGAGTRMNECVARSRVPQPSSRMDGFNCLTSHIQATGPERVTRTPALGSSGWTVPSFHLNSDAPIPKPLDPHSIISGSLKCSLAILINSYPLTPSPLLPLCPVEYTCHYPMTSEQQIFPSNTTCPKGSFLLGRTGVPQSPINP